MTLYFLICDNRILFETNDWRFLLFLFNKINNIREEDFLQPKSVTNTEQLLIGNKAVVDQVSVNLHIYIYIYYISLRTSRLRNSFFALLNSAPR